MAYTVLSYIYSQFLQQNYEAGIVPISTEKVFQKEVQFCFVLFS